MVKHAFFKITIFYASSLICSNVSGLMEGCLSKQTEGQRRSFLSIASVGLHTLMLFGQSKILKSSVKWKLLLLAESSIKRY